MKIKKYKKSEKGFVIVLAILLLLVMSLMGTTLIVIASNDAEGNRERDYNQQTFYAAETGIKEAIRWIEYMLKNGRKLNSTGNSSITHTTTFCKKEYFPSIFHPSESKIPMISHSDSASSGVLPSTTLHQIMSYSNQTERTRLSKYSYEFFITNTPDSDGSTNNRRSKQVSITSSSGTNIGESASYKQSSSSTTDAYYYTIFSCGKGENDIIVPIEAVVLVPQ